jgi:clan AA aspartic protease
MIHGVVNAALEPTINVALIGRDGVRYYVDAIVDTGFNDFLMLPSSLLTTVGSRRVGRGRAILADGSEMVFDIHTVTVLWEGRPRRVDVDAGGELALVGTRLLEGYKLDVNVLDRGKVTIKRLTPTRKRKRAKRR